MSLKHYLNKYKTWFYRVYNKTYMSHESLKHDLTGT